MLAEHASVMLEMRCDTPEIVWIKEESGDIRHVTPTAPENDRSPRVSRIMGNG